MAITVPNAGESVPGGGYPAPTPHAAVVEQTPYEAPSSLPSAPAGSASTQAFDALGEGNLGDGKGQLGEATRL